jgi:hypothetical protein
MCQNCYGRAKEVGGIFVREKSLEVIYRTSSRDWAAKRKRRLSRGQNNAPERRGRPAGCQRRASEPHGAGVSAVGYQLSAIRCASRGCTISCGHWDQFVFFSTRKSRWKSNRKGDRRKGERWLVQRGHLLTVIFYFILFLLLLVFRDMVRLYFIFFFLLFFRDTVQFHSEKPW